MLNKPERIRKHIDKAIADITDAISVAKESPPGGIGAQCLVHSLEMIKTSLETTSNVLSTVLDWERSL